MSKIQAQKSEADIRWQTTRRNTNRQAHRQIDRKSELQIDSKIDRQADRKIETERHRQSPKEAAKFNRRDQVAMTGSKGRQTYRSRTNRGNDRQTGNETDKQTDK